MFLQQCTVAGIRRDHSTILLELTDNELLSNGINSFYIIKLTYYLKIFSYDLIIITHACIRLLEIIKKIN